MTEVIKILIVEDSASDIQSYDDSIRTINLGLSPNFIVEGDFKETKDAGIAALRDSKVQYSGAFVDLKLTQGEPNLNEGNDVVEEIYGNLRFPVRVLTNTPGEIAPGLSESVFFKVKEKTSVQYVDEIMELVELHKTGFMNILGRVGIIERMLNSIFWNNISLSLDEWIGHQNAEKHLLRYILTHIQENLEITDDGSQLDVVHPIETYIKPSIKPYFFTGDIIVEKIKRENRYVILTPACDIVPRGSDSRPKASHIILALIDKFENSPVIVNVQRIKSSELSQADSERKLKARESLLRIIGNNADLKYYYLPDSKLVSGGLINFQKLFSVKVADLVGYEKEATIASQFVKDIVAKFSYYYSRQGSPDFNIESLYNKHVL